MEFIIANLSRTKEVSGFEMICYGIFILILHDVLSPLGVKLYYSVKSLFRRK